MTIINREYNYIFVHVPKAAGKSVKQHLAEHSYGGLQRVQLNMNARLQALASYASGNPIFSRLAPPTPGLGVDRRVRDYCAREGLYSTAHLRATQLIEILGNKEYRDMYSFGFVRNPWDRCLSAYFYFRRKKFHPLHKHAVTLSYEDFLVEMEQRGMPYIGQQTQWLYRNGQEKLVSFIGRVEQIEQDMAEVGSHIRLQGRRFTAQTNVSESRERDYRGYYTARTVDLVARAMRPDIELLGYCFE